MSPFAERKATLAQDCPRMLHALPRTGRTGVNVSILSQGGAAIGQQYGPVSPSEVADCVHAAIDAGVNLVDTRAYYGKGRSEEVLGEILQGGWREKIYLCTKAGRIDTNEFDFSPAAMERSLDASLSRLKTDYVDILIAHDIEFARDYDAVFTTRPLASVLPLTHPQQQLCLLGVIVS